MVAEKYVQVRVRAPDYLAIRKMADAVPGGTSITKMIAILVAGADRGGFSLGSMPKPTAFESVAAPVGRPASSRPRAANPNVIEPWAEGPATPMPPRRPKLTDKQASALYLWHVDYLSRGKQDERDEFAATPDTQKLDVVLSHMERVGLTLDDLPDTDEGGE